MALAKIQDPITGKLIEYHLDTRLKANLDNKIIPSLMKKDKDCFICVDGKEGCLFEDTLVSTDKGYKKIKDLNNGGSFNVKTLNTQTRKDENGKAICIKTGEKELFEIETEDGRKIKATKNHTFFILRNNNVCEINLSRLKEGDALICQ